VAFAQTVFFTDLAYNNFACTGAVLVFSLTAECTVCKFLDKSHITSLLMNGNRHILHIFICCLLSFNRYCLFHIM